jgi:hypothetical protein
VIAIPRQSGFHPGKTIVRLLVCCLGAAVGGVLETAHGGTKPVLEYQFVVLRFDQSHVLDPARGEFRSSQDLRISNATDSPASSIVFNSHPSLVIADLTVTDAAGEQIAKGPPRARGEAKVFRNYMFDVWEVSLNTAVRAGETVIFHIDYELAAGRALDKPRDMYEFTVSPQTCYSVYIGCNPLFGDASNARYKMVVRYPQGYVLCAPGDLVNTRSAEGHRVDTYRSETPLGPSFSCARYTKVVKSSEEVTLEYYLYPQESFADEMAQMTFEILDLYTRHFGSRGTSVYRYATVGPVNAPFPSGENKGATNFVTDFAAREFAAGSPSGRLAYFRLMSHELYHEWNLGDVTWVDSRLSEWFGEGGANFVSACAAEQILGLEAGAEFRRQYRANVVSSGFLQLEATLENVNKTGGAEDGLLYSYGALVWEQLRQKLGDEAFWAGLADFYTKNSGQNVRVGDLIACLQVRSTVDVAAHLNQWTRHNARIDLSIANVETVAEPGRWTSTVDVLVVADRDYELFTAIGLRGMDKALETAPAWLESRGIHSFVITSSQPPASVVLDPYCRVPQTNLENDELSLMSPDRVSTMCYIAPARPSTRARGAERSRIATERSRADHFLGDHCSSGGDSGGAEQDHRWPGCPIVTSMTDRRRSVSGLPRPAARGAGRAERPVAGASHRSIDDAPPHVAVPAACSGGREGRAEQDHRWPARPTVASTTRYGTPLSGLPRPAARSGDWTPRPISPEQAKHLPGASY